VTPDHRTPAPAGALVQDCRLTGWEQHICAVAEMTVLTTSACVNCVHVRCPECEVEQVEIKASR